MATWRNRIIGHGSEAPDQLLANPENWRVHPKHQQEALAGVLSEVGWVQDIIVNQRTQHVIDGHLRVSLAISRREPTVPVVYVDLDEAEESLILATLDPLSALAVSDKEQLDALLRDITTSEPALQAMLAELAKANGLSETGDEWAAAAGALPDGDKPGFQQVTFTLADSQAETVKRAITAAKGKPSDAGNANSNGNALAHICETFLGQR